MDTRGQGAARVPRRRRLVCALAGALAATLLPNGARGQNATWLANPGSGNFNAAANWNPAAVPTGTAFFDTSNTTALSFSTNTTVGGWTFNLSADNYVFTNGQTLNFTGAGIVINGGSAAITNNFGLGFLNTSTAGGATITNNFGLQFFDTSTAGSATITNNGTLNFLNASTAASAAITNNNLLRFFDTSTAGGATITNGADLQFLNASTAGGATIANNDSLRFFNTSTAGSAAITNSAALSFFDTSTAGGATITNVGQLNFLNTSTAGNAIITNNFDMLFFDASTAGSAAILNKFDLRFNNTSTAGAAAITNNLIMSFVDSSTAGSASIINNIDLRFLDASTAGSANITNRADLRFNDTSAAGNANISNRSNLWFNDSSTAGDAVITTTNGGNTRFQNTSSGGTARFVTLAGGTVDISALTSAGTAVGSIEGAGAYVLGAKTLTTGSNNLSTEVSGIVSGVGGSLSKVGAGTLTLSGMNTYTGATTVDDGRLIVNGSIVSSNLTTVNAGGTLGGTGTVGNTTIDGGTLSPGNSIGTLTVQGNLIFTAVSSYLVEISGANADRTDVTGTATLAGTVQPVVLPGGGLQSRYTILSATGGLNGVFDGVASNPFFRATLSYTATDVLLNLTLGLGQFPALNRNQHAVASTLDTAFNAGIPLTGQFATLLSLAPASMPGALSQLSGEIATAAPAAGFQSMNQFLSIMLDPFVAGRGTNATGPALAFAAAPSIAGSHPSTFASLAPEHGGAQAYAADFPAARSFEQRWSVWGGAYGGRSSREGDAAVVGSHDLSARVWALAVGADWRMNDGVLGFAIAGGNTSFGLSDGLGTGNTEFAQFGAYGSVRFGQAYVAAALAYGWHQASHERTVTFAGLDTFEGAFNAQQLGARIESGYRHDATVIAMTPYVALTAQSFRVPGYSETAKSGAPEFALTFPGRTANGLRSELGAWFEHARSVSHDESVVLRARVAWLHDYSRDFAIDAAFQVLPGLPFVVTGAGVARDAALVSVVSDVRLGGGVSFTVKFDAELAAQAQSYAGAATLRKMW